MTLEPTMPPRGDHPPRRHPERPPGLDELLEVLSSAMPDGFVVGHLPKPDSTRRIRLMDDEGRFLGVVSHHMPGGHCDAFRFGGQWEVNSLAEGTLLLMHLDWRLEDIGCLDRMESQFAVGADLIRPQEGLSSKESESLALIVSHMPSPLGDPTPPEIRAAMAAWEGLMESSGDEGFIHCPCGCEGLLARDFVRKTIWEGGSFF